MKMMSTTGIFEVVYVLDDTKLVDSEHFERAYSQTRSLAPGFYVVTWPEDARPGRFSESARFQGPYRLRLEARAVAGQGGVAGFPGTPEQSRLLPAGARRNEAPVLARVAG